MEAEALKIEYVAIDSLVPRPDNPRRNSKAIPKVAQSIQRFGWKQPILVRRANNEIIAGHTRWMAAKSLKLEKVPVVFTDMNPKDSALYNIADNKLNEEAEWDNDLLTPMLRALIAEDADGVKTAGFGEAELQKLLKSAAEPPPADDEGPSRSFNITYSIVFNTLAEQQEWFDFLKMLKKEFPKLGTVAERLMAWVRVHREVKPSAAS